ncbi:MAG: DUF2273 domain-containing protein [Clostridiales bacterium]|nr:DUF2273 domain-containing protein [Clostridiales bacterium]
MKWLTEQWNKRPGVLVGMGLGLVVGILMLTAGFWRTLLLALLIGLGAFIGYLYDKNGTDGMKDLVFKIFKGGNGS